MTIVWLLIVLPLTSLVCSWTPSLPQANGPTATPTPKGSQGNVLVDTPTATSSAGNAPSRPTAPAATTTPKGSEFSLQISWEGNYSAPNGFATVTYGPDTVTIPLESKGGTYVGSHKAVWHASVTGVCTATGSPPVSFDVTAKENASGDLDFSVNRSIVWTWDTQCPGVSGGATSANQAYTYTFTLPPEDGASKTFSPGGPKWTFTLKKLGP